MKPISNDGVTIFTLKDGKVASDWPIYGQATAFAQVDYTFQPQTAVNYEKPKAKK